MTPSDAVEFAGIMAQLGEVFSEQVSGVRVGAYFEVLSDLTLQEVRAGVRLAVKRSKFFPKPADILEALEGSDADQGEMAWTALLAGIERVGPYQSVDFGDEAIHECVRRIFGGWPEAGMMESKDVPFRHAEFLKLYRALRRRPQDPKPIPGILEMDNRSRGFVAHIPAPVMLGDGAAFVRALPPAAPDAENAP